MKTHLCFLILIISWVSGYSQKSPIDRIFSSTPPDFQFQVHLVREGKVSSYLENEYSPPDRNLKGQFSAKGNGSYNLKVDKFWNVTIKSFEVKEPIIDPKGHIVNIIQSEFCKNESSGGALGFLLMKYSHQEYYHIMIIDQETSNVNEYVIEIDQNGSSSNNNETYNLGKSNSMHVFRDVSQMHFNEDEGMWDEIEQTNNSIEIKKYTLPDSENIFLINRYIIGKTTPELSLIFKYLKRDIAQNYIYSCLWGQIDATKELDDETIESITLQSSEDLDEMVEGKDGYLTIIILGGGINCFICEN